MTDAAVSPSLARLGAASLEPGHLLAQRYRVVAFVAGGGMGEVYEVDDALLGERVALKALRLELSQKPRAQERFAEEIRLARRVTHANVCRVFDVGLDGPRVFYTMQMHRGDTLAARLRRSGPLDLGSFRTIARQLLAGVAAAHAAEVIHADLKPSNVLLTGPHGDHVVLTDFGLAISCCAELGCACESAHLMGTPAYAAPEQIAGGNAIERSDVFSIGVMFFEMLTGRLPFDGATPIEQARARLETDAPPPSKFRPDLHPDVDAVVHACLARDPDRRPANVAAVAAGLGV